MDSAATLICTRAGLNTLHNYGIPGAIAGIATFSYAPSEMKTLINEANIQIEEVTDYPFNDNILFKIKTGKQVLFPWQFRIPGWCKEAELYVNGQLFRKRYRGADYYY